MSRTAYPPLYILRHGETQWNREGRLQGHLDSPLTQTGRAQAARQADLLARHLRGPYDLYVSPAPRALETTALLRLDRALTVDPRLQEIDLGAWSGCLIADIAPKGVRPDDHLWKFDAPMGESLAAMTTRCTAFLHDLKGPSVIVTHEVTARILRLVALGLPPEDLSRLSGGQGVVHGVADGRTWTWQD